MSAPRAASAPLDLSLIRDEIAISLARVAAHAAAGSSHAQAGNDRALACEIRCGAAALMSVAALVEHLNPQRGGRRA